jgi:hypothetical protein
LNNNNNNHHRLSLQVESGDENSLVMTNEAINRTIIRIGSNGSSVDFGEADEKVIDKPNEAINHEANVRRSSHSYSENYPSDDGEVIVNILGQINDIVGFNVHCCVWTSKKPGDGSKSFFLLSFSASNFVITMMD